MDENRLLEKNANIKDGVKRLLPAYPLFVKDPYFSIWSTTEELNAENPVFWHGEEKPFLGLIKCGDKTYRFMGNDERFIKLEQTFIRITAFETVYGFSCDQFDAEISFLSPLPPNDKELLSMPVCYLSYNIIPKIDAEITIELRAEERIAYNTCFDENRKEDCRFGIMKFPDFQTSYISLLRQCPMSQSSDEFGADWGTWYLCGEKCSSYMEANRQWVVAENRVVAKTGKNSVGKFLIAFDDLLSIFYYGQWLKGYYFKDGKTIIDAIKSGYAEYESIVDKCNRFDKDLRKNAEKYGDDYLLILYASLRQSVAGHKLVQDNKGRLLFLSKECNSDGCIATVDVTYPSMPLYLLYDPDLVLGMILPILDFARMPVWEYDYAPHDAGIYPYCLGQLYAIRNSEDNPDLYMRKWDKIESLPFYYLFPKGSEIYDEERQMPVEECGNLLILAYAVIKAGGDKKVIFENFDLFKKWVKYLEEKGLIPGKQLCTDDFAGHLDKNANLSVKAIVGLAAFSKICEEIGDKDLSAYYGKVAKSFAEKWIKLCVKNGRSTLTVDGDENTFSIKYNFAFDKLMGFGLFPQELFEKETDELCKNCKKYGIPLDSRATYTKSDWNVWISAITEDEGKRRKILSACADFLRETPDRVPYSDWYETESGKRCMFRNRTVQGATFILLLKDKWGNR